MAGCDVWRWRWVAALHVGERSPSAAPLRGRLSCTAAVTAAIVVDGERTLGLPLGARRRAPSLE